MKEEIQRNTKEMRNRYLVVISIRWLSRYTNGCGRDTNQKRRARNMCITSGTEKLAPLVNVVTGLMIPGFPSCANAIDAMASKSTSPPAFELVFCVTNAYLQWLR